MDMTSLVQIETMIAEYDMDGAEFINWIELVERETKTEYCSDIVASNIDILIHV